MENEDKIIEDKKVEQKVSKTKKEEKKIIEDKKCIKCGNLIEENDSFCYSCGWNQNKPIALGKKEEKSFSILKLSLVLVLLLVFFTIALYIWRGFENSSNNINYGNKNVTINDTGIADAVEKVYDSVVVVQNYIGEKLYGTGSGFVYKTDDKYGYILTNSHVLSNATEIRVKFTNNEVVKVDVLGSDEYADVAVLKVPKKNVEQVAVIGDNTKMRPGDTTFAIGTPVDEKTYSWSVTRGILSGKDRLVSIENSYMNVLQTDTPINAGNSGGPLCNANGEVIGITNMKLASDQIEGMSFAIPIEDATDYADGIITGKKIDRPYIGVALYDAQESFFKSTTYVVVSSVERGSAAEKAGMKKDDVITHINDVEVSNVSHFKYKLYTYKVGDTVKIKVKRGKEEKTLKVTLESNIKIGRAHV